MVAGHAGVAKTTHYSNNVFFFIIIFIFIQEKEIIKTYVLFLNELLHNPLILSLINFKNILRHIICTYLFSNTVNTSLKYMFHSPINTLFRRSIKRTVLYRIISLYTNSIWKNIFIFLSHSLRIVCDLYISIL